MDLYKEASRILTCVTKKKGGIKTLTYNSSFTNKKKLYALVCETVKYERVIDEISEMCELEKREKSLRDASLTRCLVYDFLFGQGLHGTSSYKAAVLRHSAALRAALARIKIREGVSKDSELQVTLRTTGIPRYVRINTLKTNQDTVIQSFQNSGFTCHQLSNAKSTNTLTDYTEYIKTVQSLSERSFMIDPHVANLIVFSTGTDLHNNPLYVNTHIILQDKASCLPALVLNPEPGDEIIDCCAAPGNKTTHLASLINNNGKIFAFDRDPARCSILKKMVQRAGADCVTVTCADFLQVNPRDSQYKNVTRILVDPSCSGSGILDRHNNDSSDDTSQDQTERLRSLAAFQTKILRHALTFPRVTRVVYSTCSVHEEENECVVRDVLSNLSSHWSLVPALDWLPTRGRSEFEFGEQCARLDPESNLTGGFFVACLVRSESRVTEEGKVHQSESVPASDCRKDQQSLRDSECGSTAALMKKNLKRKQKTNEQENYRESDNNVRIDNDREKTQGVENKINKNCKTKRKINGQSGKHVQNINTISQCKELSVSDNDCVINQNIQKLNSGSKSKKKKVTGLSAEVTADVVVNKKDGASKHCAIDVVIASKNKNKSKKRNRRKIRRAITTLS